ncbi:hypothetical protein [Vampirovibrio sp.]|uniref:hypothetical protein n=1 Tax=Vampirovibrio sp. TaxID=2717857 RepID=UPI003593F32A
MDISPTPPLTPSLRHYIRDCPERIRASAAYHHVERFRASATHDQRLPQQPHPHTHKKTLHTPKNSLTPPIKPPTTTQKIPTPFQRAKPALNPTP